MRKQFLLGLMAMLLPWTAGAKDVTLNNFVIELPDNFVYNGGTQQPNIVVKAKDGTVLAKNTQYTISYEFGGTGATTIKDAGDYTIKVKGAGILSGYDEETTTFTVEKKSVTIELENGVTGVEKTYGQEDSEVDFAKYFVISGLEGNDTEADAVGCLTLERVNDQNDNDYDKDDVREKPYRVALKAKTPATGNYTYNPTGVNYIVDLIINPKPLTLVFEEHIYKGEAYDEKTFEITKDNNTKDYKLYTKYTEGATDNELFTTAELDITFAKVNPTDELLNVATYTLTATIAGNNNYQIGEDGTATFKISKATLTIAAIEDKNFNGYYGYNNPVDFTNYFEYTCETVEEIDIEELYLTMKREDNANVNTYPIYPYVNEVIVKEEAENEGDLTYETALQNYEISFEGAEFVINKKRFSTTADFTYTVSENADFAYQGKDFEVSNDFLSIKYNTYYNGEGQDKGKNLTYGTDYTLEVVPVATTAKNAGETFKIKVVGKNNFQDYLILETTNYEEPLKEDFTITKAPLKIIAPENASVLSKVYDGEEIGDVTDLYSFEGLVGEDVDEETNKIVPGKVLKMFSSQKDANASYIVHVVDVIQNTWPTTTGSKELKNYTFTYDEIQTKKFTILAAEFELDGSKEDDSVEKLIAAYDGKEVESVTVKNLRNYAGYKDEEGNNQYGDNATPTVFEAEKWYTLVLPFEVKVRDLSAQLGYAIVNVPDKDKTYYDAVNKKNYVYYKLEMQSVPANTLMAFKVDETTELTAEKGLTFTKNVKIEAPAEENEIVEGVEFVPVYTKETFDAENEKGENAWYLWPAAGSFYRMGALIGGKTDSFTVYPLNGYIRTIVEGAEARVFMQEADGSTTAINVVTGKAINSNTAEGWYTVGGMKLSGEPTQKGIYINNGKKVVIK